MSYYAVANGREVGIFNNWNEAKKQVIGFDGARFKKFETLEDAQNFIQNYRDGNDRYGKKETRIASNNPAVYYHVEPDDMLIVFTDGAAPDNGKAEARAAYATFWPFHREYSFSSPLSSDEKQTNVRAEMLAVLKAFQQADEIDPSRTKMLRVFTDSSFVIDLCTRYIFAWEPVGWKTAKGKEPANLDIVLEMYKYLISRRIIFCHVLAHTGGNDWLSVNNAIADELATSAVNPR